MPGDHYKDFRSDAIIDLNKVESHVAPRYVIDYKYCGKKYTSSVHAIKESIITSKIPSAAKENEIEIENNKYVKSINIITFISLLFAILSSILFPIALKIVFSVIAVAMFITNCIVKKKMSRAIYLYKQNKKIFDLMDLLKKKGIAIPKKLREGIRQWKR